MPAERAPEIPAKTEKESTSEPLLPIPGQVAPTDLATADAAFEAKKWAEAGRIYGTLADQRRLSEEEMKRWLYCRAQGVAARINAQPRTDADWAAIKEELARMKVLNSNFYLTDYLQSLASERQAAQHKPKPSKTLVVRGQAPRRARSSRPAGPTRLEHRARRIDPARSRARLDIEWGCKPDRDQRRPLAVARLEELPDLPCRPRTCRQGRSSRRDCPGRSDQAMADRDAPERLVAALRDLPLSLGPAICPDDRPARGFARLLDNGHERRSDQRPGGSASGPTTRPRFPPSCRTSSLM